MTNSSWLWQPPNEAIETLTGVLRAHWAAAKSQHAELFWPRPASWLRRQATRLVGNASDSAMGVYGTSSAADAYEASLPA